MKLHRILPLLVAVSSLFFISGCDKDNDADTTELKIRMTDNPFNATAVNIDIEQVRVKLREDGEDWITLNTRAGIYNLLDYQNGIDTLLAQGIVPVGPLREIRFVLGSDNSIEIAGISYPLTIPSGSESGLKIKLNKSLAAGSDSVLIDFDAALSIFQTGTAEFKLKPVLKIK
jgi:hypothetical protein